jgi:hypothetical protein
VIVVGLDLHDKSPLADWPARTKFLERVLGRKAQRASQANGVENFSQGKRLGFIDISGQLRAALDQFAAVEFVPFWAVAGTALVFIGLLFPLNYLLVHRWLNRQWLAWFVFAASIIAFSAGAYAWANRAKGNGLHANQVDLVDVDLQNGRVRGTTWFNLFNPENSKFDLKLDPEFAGMKAGNGVPGTDVGSNCLLTWLGLPGEGLGGMSSRAANAPLFDEPYTINAKPGEIEGAPVAIWSSKSFVARWESRGSGIDSQIAATAGGKLRGTLVNQLGVPLQDCVLFYGGWAYPLENLATGQTVEFDRRDPASALSVLTLRSTWSPTSEVASYDRAGFEATRILQVMMFYDLAGGSNYTGLLNRYQSFVDLSHQLNFGRAILVGRGPSGATLQINGQPLEQSQMNRHDTMYRFLLPVQRASD